MRINYLLLLSSLFFLPLYAGSYSTNSLAEAFRTGFDTDGKPLFLCIGKLFGSRQPGKTWQGYKRCNIPYGGKEYIVDHFEIPSRRQFHHSYWQRDIHLAVQIGQDTNGNRLFLCQTLFQGSRQPGKTWPGYNHCNISYGGREIITDNYSVLTIPRDSTTRSQVHQPTDVVAKCLHGNFGDKACGYNCVRSISRVACAKTPDEQCMADKFGRISCGRNCRIDQFNRVKCLG
ncbi:hypothetical protein BN59_00801 [Legionella massiliensis]|uniref:Uncharacterized protein n=1 Tax=Legionella massiliensis TaxID=1034943 RepID=A0A078KU09_9GAMM|nr:DUF3421 domain-containing protein [Legionella massiliensis]CDZ76531.1 hypothetical protein BN59_00801 [Legionella massiliensis]CEE12269.1 hypothetical protein BN1094_00801 [Legionella massiliensis]